MSKAHLFVSGPSQIQIVEASAGSGKTYALAKRYVQLLLTASSKLEDIPLRHILAITFTNKAALEMKERILEFLKKIALGHLSQDDKAEILGPLSIDEDLARKKAYRAMDYLIKNYNFFQVQTIDSFVNALLSGCSFKIDLSANFKIQRNYADYLLYSLDQLIDKAHYDKDVHRLFERFLKQYLFVENKTSWMPKKDMLILMNSLFSSGNLYGGQFVRFPAFPENVFALQKKILESMQKLEKQLPEGVNKTFARGLEDFLKDRKDNFDVDALSKYFTYEDFPVRKGKNIHASIAKLWKAIRADIKSLCEMEAFSTFNCYIDIFEVILGDLMSRTSQDDILFLEELNNKARRLFDKEALTVEELYYRMATRFRHYLIDEFQDTSFLQWKNLKMMIEEALSTGGTLFYVGDKKQAIYRFRGGEVLLFDDIQNQLGAHELQHGLLRKNYRSHKEIVLFNNEVFNESNLRRFVSEVADKIFDSEDISQILEVFKDARQQYRDDRPYGFVFVENIEGEDKGQRELTIKEKVIETIRELKTRFSYGDIAILTRGNDEVKDITGWLLEEEIPVESERTLNVRENPLIKELVSFLKFLSSPIDNLSFSSFILGEIFQRSTGMRQQEMRDFIFRLSKSQRAERNIYYYRIFRQEYPEIWEKFMEGFFKGVGFYPLYELVVSILNQWNVLKNFPQYQGFVMRFLELIKEKESEVMDIASFLEYFDQAQDEDLYVFVNQADAVKVFTIHKSKGLEFPVVIIPFLEMNVKVGSRHGAYVVLPDEEELKLLRLKKCYQDFSPLLRRIYSMEYKKSFIDELNNIYVALTRAKEELYVFIPRKVSKRMNFARSLIPGDMSQRGEKRVYRESREEAAVFDIPAGDYQDWILQLKNEFLDERQFKNRDRLLKGEILHFILSNVGNLEGKDKQAVLKEAYEKATFVFPYVDQWSDFQSIVGNLLEKQEFKKFFCVKGADVFQEKEVIDRFGNSKRVDRMVVTDNEVWIVDFKSSREDEDKHLLQIREYVDIVKAIYPHKEPRGYLVYLDSYELVEINE